MTRFITPVVIAYVYLGAPRTTRQSRYRHAVSRGRVMFVRFAGFASIVVGAYAPMALAVQYAHRRRYSVRLRRDLACLVEPPVWMQTRLRISRDDYRADLRLLIISSI